MFRQNLKNFSEQVKCQSQQSRCIPQSVIDKYLNEPSIIQDCLQNLRDRIRPYWQLSSSVFFHNIKNLWSTKWQFNQQNNSLYLVFWVPLTAILISYMMVNSPESGASWKIFIPAIIIMLTTLMTAFAMFVYCNVMTCPHKKFIMHLSVSSYISIMTAAYTLSVVGFQHIIGGQFIAIGSLASVIYVLLASYLHFFIYNLQVKPTLLQMISLVVILLILYISTSIIFYQFYSEQIKQIKTNNPNTHAYIMLRQYL